MGSQHYTCVDGFESEMVDLLGRLEKTIVAPPALSLTEVEEAKMAAGQDLLDNCRGNSDIRQVQRRLTKSEIAELLTAYREGVPANRFGSPVAAVACVVIESLLAADLWVTTKVVQEAALNNACFSVRASTVGAVPVVGSAFVLPEEIGYSTNWSAAATGVVWAQNPPFLIARGQVGWTRLQEAGCG